MDPDYIKCQEQPSLGAATICLKASRLSPWEQDAGRETAVDVFFLDNWEQDLGLWQVGAITQHISLSQPHQPVIYN